MTLSKGKKARLSLRNPTFNDVKAISELVEKVYPDMAPWTLDSIRSQLTYFPEGNFIAVFDDKVVGYSASIRVPSTLALKPHTWDEITGHGTGSTDDPNGDYLYGMETCVDNTYQNLHIGQRIYNERKKLCIRLHLKGIITGGRLSLYAQEVEKVKNPEKYIELVQLEKIKDHTLLFQLHNGFEVLGILKNYLPDDPKSL